MPRDPFPKNAEIFRWGPITAKHLYPSEGMFVIMDLYVKKFPAYPWPETLILCREPQMVWINEMTSLTKNATKTFVELVFPDKKRNLLKKEWNNSVKKLQQFWKRVDKLENHSFTALELKKNWEEFYLLMLDFWLPTIPSELGNYGSTPLLHEKLTPFISNKNELSAILEILTTPEELSFYQVEEIELSETSNLEMHQKEYFWLQNSYNGTKILPISFFAERKKQLSPHIRKEFEQKLQEIKKKKKEVKEKYHLPDEVMHIADVLVECIAWQDQRKKYIFILQHYKDFFLNQIAEKMGYAFNDLQRLCPEEVLQLLKGKDMQAMITKRRKSFGFHCSANNIQELSHELTEKYWNEYAEEKVNTKMDSFSGIVASKGNGNVKGKIRIVLDPMQSSGFKEGEILVAPMTSPEYVFLMKKAKGIITDAGGLTSHAAIVSRELHKPCLVGTKVATRVLRNGDEVEINTEKGIIRKVSNE